MALLLKATELGLSTLVMGIRDAAKISEILEIPENEAVVSVISVGYSDADRNVRRANRSRNWHVSSKKFFKKRSAVTYPQKPDF